MKLCDIVVEQAILPTMTANKRDDAITELLDALIAAGAVDGEHQEEYKKSMFDAMECIKNHPPMSLVDAKELIAKGENVVEKLDVDQVQRLKGFFRLGKAQLALKLYEDSFESLQEGCRISDEYINKVRNKLVVVEVRERSEICRVFAHS